MAKNTITAQAHTQSQPPRNNTRTDAADQPNTSETEKARRQILTSALERMMGGHWAVPIDERERKERVRENVRGRERRERVRRERKREKEGEREGERGKQKERERERKREREREK
jgi:hypothetical protein